MTRSSTLVSLLVCFTAACATADVDEPDAGITVQLPAALGGGSDVTTPLVPSAQTATLHGLGAIYVPPPAPQQQTDAAVIDVALPASADISSEAPPPGDQGQTGSCTTWSTAHSALGWWAWHEGYGAATFAPMYLYSQFAKGNCDTGSTIEHVLGMIKSHGVDTQTDYEPMQVDLDCATQPASAQKTNAARFKISGYSQSSLANGARNAIETIIASGRPALLAINVYPEFDNATASSYLVGAPSAGETSRGGHAIAAFAYDANGVWILNSWGSGWARNGWAELSWDFVGGTLNGMANLYDVAQITGISLDESDTNASCPLWAFTDQCQDNPSYMLANCSLSCANPYPTFTSPASWFRIQNVALGGDYSLDTGVIASTGNYTGQEWMLSPLGNNYYRLTNNFQGTAMSFDTTQMASSGNYTGQEWLLVPITNDVYRLTNDYLGPGTSLAVDTGTHAIESVPSAEDDRQYWQITSL
jgi:hypothetical protein